jgi:hypothetical protein
MEGHAWLKTEIADMAATKKPLPPNQERESQPRRVLSLSSLYSTAMLARSSGIARDCSTRLRELIESHCCPNSSPSSLDSLLRQLKHKGPLK